MELKFFLFSENPENHAKTIENEFVENGGADRTKASIVGEDENFEDDGGS